MGGALRNGIGMAAALAVLAAVPARAGPCWTEAALDAARVQELQVMLLGVNLRCKAAGIDIEAQHDQFLIRHAGIFAAIDQMLKAQFDDGADRRGHGEFATYMTRLGNYYGVGRTDAGTCAIFGALASDLSKDGTSAATLTAYARELVEMPRFIGAACPAQTVRGTR